MHLRARTAALAALVLIVATGAAGAAARGPLRADLDGEPIALEDVANYDCHDADYPLIHCYRSSADLDDSLARYTAEAGAEAVTAGTAYVRAYRDATFSGGSFTFSQNYANLESIGWNDRISSLQSLNCGRGEFREHANYLGFVYTFYCGSLITYVGDYYNDKFSSVERLP